MKLSIATQSLLIQVDIWHKSTLIHAIDAVGDFHLINSTDLVEHDLTVLNLVLV